MEQKGPEHTFPNEAEYICKRLCGCCKFGSDCSLQPYQCKKALAKVSVLKQHLVLGNNASARMSFEDMRVAKDYFFFVSDR